MNKTKEKLVFEQNDSRIYFHPRHKVLHLKWDGPDCRSVYAEVLEALKTLTLELKAEGWLFNLSKCKHIQTEGGTQGVEKLAASLSGSSLKKYARVVSMDAAYEGVIKEKINILNKEYNLGLEVGNFETEADALAWLFSASAGTLVEE